MNNARSVMGGNFINRRVPAAAIPWNLVEGYRRGTAILVNRKISYAGGSRARARFVSYSVYVDSINI